MIVAMIVATTDNQVIAGIFKRRPSGRRFAWGRVAGAVERVTVDPPSSNVTALLR
jgi:hypothetical protein